MRISDWSSDVCSSDLASPGPGRRQILRWGRSGQRAAEGELVLPGAQVLLSLEGRGHPHPGALPGERGDGSLHPLERVASVGVRSEEHTSELKSLMRISYAVFCLKTTITNVAQEQ